MRGLLTLGGVLTLGGGLALAALVYAADLLVPLWVPITYVVGGFFGSLVWFALAEILKRLEELQIIVGKPSS